MDESNAFQPDDVIDYINAKEQGVCGEYHGGPSWPDCREGSHNWGRRLLDQMGGQAKEYDYV